MMLCSLGAPASQNLIAYSHPEQAGDSDFQFPEGFNLDEKAKKGRMQQAVAAQQRGGRCERMAAPRSTGGMLH